MCVAPTEATRAAQRECPARREGSKKVAHVDGMRSQGSAKTGADRRTAKRMQSGHHHPLRCGWMGCSVARGAPPTLRGRLRKARAHGA